MSICWDCQKKNACGTLYLNGEQQTCQERQQAYQSFDSYLRWLAKPSGYSADYLVMKRRYDE